MFYKTPILRHLPFLVVSIIIVHIDINNYWFYFSLMLFLHLVGILIHRNSFWLIIINSILFLYPYINTSKTYININNTQGSFRGKIIIENIWKVNLPKTQYITFIEQKKYLVYSKNNHQIALPSDTIWDNKLIVSSIPKYIIKDFDYGQYLIDNGFSGVIYLSKNQKILRNTNISILNQFSRWRWKKINDFQKSNDLSKINKGIYLALTFGDRGMLGFEQKQFYVQTGIFHVLAISGLHVGIAYVVVLFLMRLLFIYNKWLQLFLIIIFLGLYTYMAGNTISVTRAFFMFILIHIGNSFALGQKTVNTTLFVALLMLIYQPTWLFNIGFQLTFSAVLAIVIFHPKLKKYFTSKLTNSKGYIFKTLNYILDLFLVSLVSFMATTPILAYHLGVVYPMGILLGLIFIPIFTILVILTLISLLLSIILNFNYILILVNYCLSFLNECVEFFAPYSPPLHFNFSIYNVILIYFSSLCIILPYTFKYFKLFVWILTIASVMFF
jgi:competence protein ComEC